MSKYTLGQIVSLNSNNNIKGAIIDITQLDNNVKYSVFADGKIQSYFETQLSGIVEVQPSTNSGINELNNLITSIQITNPSMSNLYSLNTARIDFIPYQFRPVLKFIRSDRPRILIADGVGVGKTIEAGLILRELQARRTIKSILIICPRPLVAERKWENEMKRFDEKFIHLDGESLRYCISEMDLEGEWPEQYSRAIMPFSLFDETLLRGTTKEERRKRKVGLLDLDPPPRFDLVIVDEAHHIRNANTIRHEVVSYFCDHAEAVVFLTATPIQIGNQDLFVLLKILRPDLVIDKESFKHLTEPNPFINRAIKHSRDMNDDWQFKTLEAVNEAAATSWGRVMLYSNPDYVYVTSTLAKESVSEKERINIIGKIESLHTLSGIISRTRRRDIGNFTVRKPESVYVSFTPKQKLLHDAVLAIQEEIFSSIHCTNNIKFMLTTIRRQTASCIFGLKPFLKSILTKHLDDLELLDEEDISNDESFQNDISGINSRIERIIKEAENLDNHDPKFDALFKIVSEKQQMTNRRVMLFSTFRHTLFYVYKKLLSNNIRVGLIHGGVNDEDRRELRHRFELESTSSDAIDVLLFSEVGCEGLDYQFCDCMVNYDLPWNPMRIEQRIGRIDRNGQKSDSVLIYNLITPDTIDAEVYERCLMRIGVFSESIGDCEEILGEITTEIQNISNNYLLNEIETKKRLQQLADNQIRLLQEQEQLEKKQFELFGINLAEANVKEQIENATSYWLKPICLLSLINTYFDKKGNKEKILLNENSHLKAIRISQDVRKKLLYDYLLLPITKNTTYTLWEKWLRGDNPYIKITFDGQQNVEFEDLFFITPMHPLVLQAAKSITKHQKHQVALTTKSTLISAGVYHFGIYQWQYTGLKSNTELMAISNDAHVTEHLFKLLENANDDVISKEIPIVTTQIENQHYQLWAKAKQGHLQATEQIIKLKKESLQSSHNARLALINEQLLQAKNDKIIKMRKAQIVNAETDFNYRYKELQQAAITADIVASNIIFGTLKVNM